MCRNIKQHTNHSQSQNLTLSHQTISVDSGQRIIIGDLSRAYDNLLMYIIKFTKITNLDHLNELLLGYQHLVLCF